MKSLRGPKHAAAVRATVAKRPGDRRPVEVPVFCYGSYMDPQILKRFGAAPSEPRPAKLAGWRITFSPHANLVRGDENVHGFVFELPHAALARLYGPEGFVTTYVPVPVLVQTEQGDMPALTYVEDAPERPPEPAYLEAFLDICRRLGLPRAYADHVAARAGELAKVAA